MWSNKEVRAEAWTALKRNYLVLVFICFSLLFLEIIPGTGTTLLSLEYDTVYGGEAAQEEYQSGLTRYLYSIVEGKSTEQQQQIAKEALESFNGLGGNVYGILRGIDRFIFANDFAAKALIVVSTIIYLIWFYMIRNQIYAGYLRVNMDAQDPDRKIQFTDLFQIFRAKGFMNVAKVSAICYFTLDVIILAGLACINAAIWYATNDGPVFLIIILCVLGAAAICYWLYRYMVWCMVSFILATNPQAPAKEVFALSKRMMDGHKWELTTMRLGYIGWDILAILTLGIVDVLYLGPATFLAFANCYMKLRANAIATEMPGYELIQGDNYALNELEENKFGKMIEDRNPMRDYDLVNIVLFFFIFAFGGWCWEVLIHIIKDGVFVNRGTMHGPWLPIYGVGGAGIILFLRRFAKKPLLLIISIFVGCGILEYLTHWYLELTKGIKWWDYSNYFLNLNGRICFEGLFVFCIAGVFAVYVAGPALDDLLNRVSKKTRWIVAGILMVIFGCDLAYSHNHPNVGKGITDYDKK